MFHYLILFLAVLMTALSAGLLFGYACSVNPGLNRLPDGAYLQAMQHINRVIQNPVFFVCYFGPVLLLPLSGMVTQAISTTANRCFWAASVIYILGTVGITIIGNVPLNNMLERFDLSMAAEEALQTMRAKYEAPWNRFHLWRTVIALIAAGFAATGLFFYGREAVIR